MSKKIMIVDDSSMMRLVVHNVLQEAGYNIVEASNGLDALGKLQGGEKVDLIICDVNMPEMDGLTFVQTYRAIPELQYIPVLMLTTEIDEEKKKVAKAAGVRAWMVKPFNKDILLSAVAKLV
ncbi:response regulator [Sulfuricurvum sp.]|uniref:response regulator n=1 Tax=Sulfuricurvum sp. TaxID=2025608 RepID=UPI00199BA134|nr:response regulator [Sulfuricurvum sp.]MBD3805937.1 response regulator [Sulfuricurvum sp.]